MSDTIKAFDLDASDYTESKVADLDAYVGADDYVTAELQDFSEGDIVEYADGEFGVVTAKMEENFEWPAEDVPEDQMAEEQDDDELPTLKANSEEPIYIVAKMAGGSQPFSGSDLNEADADTAFGDEEAEPGDLADGAELASIYSKISDPYDFEEFNVAVEELQNIPGVDDPEVGFDDLPDGWDRSSVLQAWASLGGTFRTCRADMAGEIRSPTRFCAALKDEVLGTERWRNRF